MKVRVLYPTGLAGTKYADSKGGQVITMDDDRAAEFIRVGTVEAEDTKPPVERATAAPGEKRATRRPRRPAKT